MSSEKAPTIGARLNYKIATRIWDLENALDVRTLDRVVDSAESVTRAASQICLVVESFDFVSFPTIIKIKIVDYIEKHWYVWM